MTIIVFHRKTWTIHEKSPSVKDVPKHAILCALGDKRQKWYHWTPLGWLQVEGYAHATKHEKLLKTVALINNKQVPTQTGARRNWIFDGKSYT